MFEEGPPPVPRSPLAPSTVDVGLADLNDQSRLTAVADDASSTRSSSFPGESTVALPDFVDPQLSCTVVLADLPECSETVQNPSLTPSLPEASLCKCSVEVSSSSQPLTALDSGPCDSLSQVSRCPLGSGISEASPSGQLTTCGTLHGDILTVAVESLEEGTGLGGRSCGNEFEEGLATGVNPPETTECGADNLTDMMSKQSNSARENASGMEREVPGSASEEGDEVLGVDDDGEFGDFEEFVTAAVFGFIIFLKSDF